MFWDLIACLIILPIILLVVVLFGVFVLIPCAFIFASWYMRIKERKLQRRKRDGPNVAFFHPHCNAAGGGERVLWVAIKALLSKYPDANIHIYTVDKAEPKTILDKVQNQFNVKVEGERLKFLRLSMGAAIDPKSYPYFTLLMQSLGSMVLGMEAFMKLNPDVYIDTTGCAFTYPIFRYLAQCPVGNYTHYPTITSAMMRRVKLRARSYNNSGLIASNPILTWCKVLYYKIFGWLYSLAGRCADVTMVNGTWTEEHIQELWGVDTHRVYPPCEVSELKKLRSLVRPGECVRILSVAQFRPEKEHPLMLQALYELRTLLANNEPLWNRIKLVFVGSCRDTSDEERVRHLRDLARHLALEDNVEFHVNAPFARLLQLYQTSTLAMHAMWNEHFGISVVECMAAGLVVIAHRSGGPRADLVRPHQVRTGYLAAEPDEYARAVLEALALTDAERQEIVDAARASVDRFSTAEFEKSFLAACEPLMSIE